MQIGVVASDCGPFHGSIFFLLRQSLKRVVNRFAGQIALFNPAFGSISRSYLGEAALAVQHFYALAVFYSSGLVVHLCQLVTKRDLGSGYVINFEHPLVMAA